MIQPLKYNSNIKFNGNESLKNSELFKDFQKPATVLNSQATQQNDVANLNTAKEESIKQENIFSKTKKGIINTLKNFNTTTNTTLGFIKGLIFGSITTSVVGVMGKNIKDSKGQIWGTTIGILKDAGKGIIKTVESAPSLITKAPIENIKTLSKLPKKFYKEYLKGNKTTAAIATTLGLGILAYNTLKGKIVANKKNADVDHYTNTGHIKTN